MYVVVKVLVGLMPKVIISILYKFKYINKYLSIDLNIFFIIENFSVGGMNINMNCQTFLCFILKEIIASTCLFIALLFFWAIDLRCCILFKRWKHFLRKKIENCFVKKNINKFQSGIWSWKYYYSKKKVMDSINYHLYLIQN